MSYVKLVKNYVFNIMYTCMYSENIKYNYKMFSEIANEAKLIDWNKKK